ncbi:uncharacterized protein EI90DRAFT_1724254 [Cantharellus anzutake]|uniref:uncharacterized protein n=1 Tax=Cantharellus anzutake TaxID=1750568 RepID=UPI00190642FF|nr:uncharacterized protein EI90DRAFT_1724254 [Cantharellus anzutake]KAF8341338.1 hypothetical protein EI90DRAFT_1724254 [Cantharellus anzutake]
MSTIPIPEDVERHQTPHASHTYPAPVTRYNTSARSASVSPIPPALVHQPDYPGPPIGPQHPPDLLLFNSPPSELRVSDSTEPSMSPKSVPGNMGPEESLAYGHTNTVPRSLSISTPKLSEPSSIPMDNPRRASWMVPFASTGRHFDIGSSLLQAELTAPQTSSFQQTLAEFILWDTHSSRIPSQYYISTFRGTSQYAVGGLSACGFACLLAAKRILLLGRSCRSGSSEVSEFARTIDDVHFHQSIIEPCAKLDSTSHFEVEDILALPMFRYSLRLVSTMYQQCRVEHFAKLVE